jgi:hypothetical protein
MRVAVESWAPEYGAPTRSDPGQAPTVPTDLGVEVPPDRWTPITPPPGKPDGLLFVDGVRRIEARVWIEPDAGPPSAGICASYGAGAVRCNGEATIERTEVRRSLLCREGGPDVVRTDLGDFERHTVAGDDTDELVIALQGQMAALEAEVSAAVDRGDDELLVVDGPLTHRREALVGAVGYVKTHQKPYLSVPAAEVVPALDPGQRTPLFRIGGPFERWSWYLRLPCPRDHGWSGVVRCEVAGDRPLADALTTADRITAALPRFASEGHKDPRAPQNLYPIGGLERELRRRLGDPRLWFRSLRAAVTDRLV